MASLPQTDRRDQTAPVALTARIRRSSYGTTNGGSSATASRPRVMAVITDRSQTAVDFIILSALMLGLAHLFNWDSIFVVVLAMGAYTVGTIGRYVWWHFKPPKASEPQPETRYTKH